MTIRLRITLFVILTFVAIAAIGGYAVFQSSKSAVEVSRVTEGVMPSVLASSDLIAQVKQVQLSAMAMVSEPDNTIAVQDNDKLKLDQAALGSALDLQMKSASSDAQRGLVKQARESLENYFNSIDAVVKLKLAGKNEIAQASFFGNVVQYQVELSQIVDTLRIEKNRSKDAAIAALNANLKTTTMAISIVTVLAILLLSALGYALYRQIVKPITRMQMMMTEIAANQDFNRSVPVDRMDEIGHSIVAFNGMIDKIRSASMQLGQKTADMQTMLQNIPQGILTIMQGDVVHHEYSAYLETLFETNDIAGRNVMELVFADTNLGADALSQVSAIGGACIGEDLMNFEFNEHLMVGEIAKTMADGRVKVFDLSWSPIVDDTDTIVRLMLCVRDVTELRELAAEAGEQKRELEIIGEILAVSPEKFHAFTADATRFVDENIGTVHQNPEITAFAIAKLFRNMHTIKGNARTYGLLHLANLVHGVEQHYEDLRHPESGAVWEQSVLLQQLDEVSAIIARYQRISSVTLGRGADQAAGLEHYLTIDRKHIQESLHRLETVNTANLHELVAVRNAVRKTLRLLGTETMAQTLSSVTESLPALAADLGKAEPAMMIEDNGYVIHSQSAGALKNIFMHLIRNAMDHGLESADQRLAKGKPAAGTIKLELGVLAGQLQMALSDDGRGLALAHIRGVAIGKQLIEADAALTDEEVAALIMRPGFSTKDTVTEISGRGVGMDAVRDFVTRENGHIELRFTDDAVGADFRQFQVLVSFPESMAVEVDGIDAPYIAAHHEPVRPALPAQDLLDFDPRVA